METLRIFGRGEAEMKVFVLLRKISANGQWKCYDGVFILRHSRIFYLAVNCSGGVYFGFSYLGELDFGHYDTGGRWLRVFWP